MRTAAEAEIEVLEYVIGLASLNESLWRQATDMLNETRQGAIHAIRIGQRRVLTAELALADETRPTAIPERAVWSEARLVEAWDDLFERIKALWREYEFGERQDGPGMATEPPELTQDTRTHQREPGEEG